MGNEYFIMRDDGEAYGPFDEPDSCLVWLLHDHAGQDIDDGILPQFKATATALMTWYDSMATEYIAHSSHSYAMWLRAAKMYAASVDYLIFGFETVVDPNEGEEGRSIRGIAHLIEPHNLHSPKDDSFDVTTVADFSR